MRWRVLAAGLLLTACGTSALDPVVPATEAVPTVEPVLPVAVTAAPTTPPPAPAPVTVPSPARVLRRGGDISWPQCPLGTPGALPERQAKGLPLPGPEADFVVIGLTNGPGFTGNPCLGWELRQARARGLAVAAYAFLSFPTQAQQRRYGGLRAAAQAQAQLNLTALRRSGLRTPVLWTDVEPQSLAPWSDDPAANRLVITTARAAYRAAGYRTGYYSSDNPWKQITGGMRSDDPVWVTVGPRGHAAAVAKCSAPTFSGGRAVLAQWWDDETKDLDLVCPGVDAAPFFS